MDFFERYGIKDSDHFCVPECREKCKCGPMRMFADGSYSRDFVYKITDHNFGRDLERARSPHTQRETSIKLGIDLEVYLYLERGRRYTISEDGKSKIMAQLQNA